MSCTRTMNILIGCLYITISEIYTPSESADGAEICSPMETEYNVRRVYYYNRLSNVSVHISYSSLDLVQRDSVLGPPVATYDIVQLSSISTNFLNFEKL